MLCVTCPVLTYLVTGSLYLLTTFIQFLLSPALNLGNHKSDLFFYELVCFWSIIDLQHDVSSWHTTQWFNISIHYKMITMIKLVVICNPTKLLHYYWLIFPTLYISYLWFIYCITESLYLLNLSHLFLFSSALSPVNHLFVLYTYDSVFV